jgi:hypothetical protein
VVRVVSKLKTGNHMKKIIALTLCGLAGVAQAGGNAPVLSSSSQQQTTNSTSVAQAQNAGNSQNITFTSPPNTTSTVSETISGNTSASETIKNVPSINGPNLTTSNDTCMGSTSGSVNIAGLGIGGGTSWTDKNCVMLKNARELWNMGMKAAAMARMCMDADNKAALEITGFECPQTKQDRAKAEAAVAGPHASASTPRIVLSGSGEPTNLRSE